MKKVFSQIQMTTWIKVAGVKPQFGSSLTWANSLGDRILPPGLRSQFPHLLKRDYKANLRA